MAEFFACGMHKEGYGAEEDIAKTVNPAAILCPPDTSCSKIEEFVSEAWRNWRRR